MSQHRLNPCVCIKYKIHPTKFFELATPQHNSPDHLQIFLFLKLHKNEWNPEMH